MNARTLTPGMHDRMYNCHTRYARAVPPVSLAEGAPE